MGAEDIGFGFFTPAKVIKVEHGVGSFLDIFLDGRLPLPAGGHRDSCKIQIWVYLCDWVMFEGDIPVLNSETIGSSDQTIPLSSFQGTTLMDLRLDEGAECVVLDFDHQLCLKLTPDVDSYGTDEDLFRVYMDDSILYSFSWSGKFQWDTPSKEH